MTNCDLQKLSLYVDGELSLPETLQVRTHLAECRPCSEEVQTLREMNRVLATWGAHRTAMPAQTDVRVRRTWERRRRFAPVFSLARVMPAAVGTSAAALLLVVSANLGSLLHSQAPTPSGSVAAQQRVTVLARQSRPLLIARRSSAILGTHVQVSNPPPRSRILVVES